jgi:hypothetical protein
MTSNAPVRAERVAWAVILAVGGSPAMARADAEDPFSAPAPAVDVAPIAVTPARTPRSRQDYKHWIGGLYVGRGLRLNNPYRLSTVLGDDAESLSLTATYLDLHIGRTFSEPDGFEHGIAVHFSIATDGIRQEVLSPSYLLLRRFSPRLLGYARAGAAIVLEPDASVGLEAGVAGVYFVTANLGFGAELDFSVFYGAATIDRAATTIPVASLALGAFFDWEQLP